MSQNVHGTTLSGLNRKFAHCEFEGFFKKVADRFEDMLEQPVEEVRRLVLGDALH